MLHLKTSGERILSVDKVVNLFFFNLTRIEYNQKQARFMFLFCVCHLITQAGNQLIWNFEGSHGGNLLELDERENLLSPVS